ncbi:MAG: type I-U CRISPR-associated protein Cas5/Cas6, partial [Verrucomicrobia bacterium]|nr:type I-U CRISPR-associated protein Cas5/Cas6 [Verrucomicrobiota bacterium]
GPRFALVPLPSIEWRGDERQLCVGSIRRALVTALGAVDRATFGRFVRQLNGRELIDAKTGQPAALLVRQLGTDSVAQRYQQESAVWASVSPVILPGYDDPRKLRRRLQAEASPPLTANEKNEVVRKLDARIEHLLRKAIVQAGYSEALARYAGLEWRSTGYWPGAELVSRYAVPDQHRRFRRLHVRITWRSPDGRPLKVAGPICIGGGRHTGLGLFAALLDDAT